MPRARCRDLSKASCRCCGQRPGGAWLQRRSAKTPHDSDRGRWLMTWPLTGEPPEPPAREPRYNLLVADPDAVAFAV